MHKKLVKMNKKSFDILVKKAIYMKIYFVYNTNMEPVPVKYISRKKLINKLGIQNREKHPY